MKVYIYRPYLCYRNYIRPEGLFDKNGVRYKPEEPKRQDEPSKHDIKMEVPK